MTATDALILLTASDLPFEDIPCIESNCACPNPGDGIVRYPMTQVSECTAYRLAALHTDRVSPNFLLAFNPLSTGGVSVFNQPVLDLLWAFEQPRTLHQGVQLAGNLPNALSTAQRLAHLGLLAPVDAPRRHKRCEVQTLTAWLHVTNACNLRCPYCYADKSYEKMETERGIQAVDAVFRSAVANGFRRVKLKYAGGEPTLNFSLVPALDDHARRLADQHRLELESVVLSNGVALTDHMIEAMQTRGIRLMISLDGVGKHHDAQRPFINGCGSFRYVERTLDRLAAHSFKPSISITVSNRNLQGLPEVVGYVLKRGLPFNLNFYREHDCLASTDLAYHEEQIIAAMEAAFAVIEANLPPHSLLGSLVDLARLDTQHNRTCGVGDSYMVINHCGGVTKCHMELGQTITDIDATDPLRLIRADCSSLQNPPVEEKEDCKDCIWRHWCGGGCPALTHRMTGRYDLKSPNCRIYKALFPQAMRLEALRLLKYSGTTPL